MEAWSSEETRRRAAGFVVDKEEYAYLPDVVVVYTFAPSMDDTAAVDRR